MSTTTSQISGRNIILIIILNLLQNCLSTTTSHVGFARTGTNPTVHIANFCTFIIYTTLLLKTLIWKLECLWMFVPNSVPVQFFALLTANLYDIFVVLYLPR